MDSPELPVGFLKAGSEYNTRLRELGLRSDMIAWGYDFSAQSFHLILVWGGVDKFGPLAVTQLLFDAYNASALPKEIDPFSVIAVGLAHPVADLLEAFRREKDNEAVQMGTRTPFPNGEIDPDLNVDRAWIVSLSRKRKTSLDVVKDWRRFSQKVASLAAA